MLKKRTFFLVLVSLIPLSFILTQCFTETKADPRGETYAGPDKCVKCHSSVYNSYLHTAHFKTSEPADLNTIKGSFNPGSNTLDYADGMKVVMEKRDDSLYQVGYEHGKQTDIEPFDITIGNAKAQTYMYWKGSQLFELPVSYFTAIHNWASSPGYVPDRPNFGRHIIRKCMECHSSYIEDLPNDQMIVGFEKESLVYGIDCERCHGPAANHVNYQTEHPEDKTAKFITTYASMSRTQKLDACAVCHSGNKNIPQLSGFKFKMGDTLVKDPHQGPLNPQVAMPDVHGNQSGLLAASKCFIMSKMDCGTCHNPHVNQTQGIAMYTQKCLSCHSEAKHNFCPLAPQLGTAIKTYCVNCHMPELPSRIIRLQSSAVKTNKPYLVRSHYIAVYPEEVKKVQAFLAEQKGAK